MRRIVLAMLVACVPLAGASGQDGTGYAAVAANKEGNLLVRWGKTEQEAKQKAAAACKNISSTCANDPASTNQLEDVFAYVCCNKPQYSCGNSPHETREKAVKEVRDMMASHGYSECVVRAYFSAKTGKKQ